MRRPPDGGQGRATVLILLLGASGCAGFSQRTTGILRGPPARTAKECRRAGPFLVVARPRQANRRRSEHRRGNARRRPEQHPTRASPRTQTATEPLAGNREEWVARNFPRINRLWNGTPAAMPARPSDPSAVTSTNRRGGFRTRSRHAAATASAPACGWRSPANRRSGRPPGDRRASSRSGSQAAIP